MSARHRTYGSVCRNCNRATVNRPRGLCWSCYYAPGVKVRYPNTGQTTPIPNGTELNRTERRPPMLELITANVCLECVAGAILGILLLCFGVLNDSEDVSDEDYSI